MIQILIVNQSGMAFMSLYFEFCILYESKISSAPKIAPPSQAV